jgi:hypothetical protein
MFLLHEPESSTMPSRSSAEADMPANTGEDYEDELIWLLSQLEFKRQGLEALRANGRISSMLEQATQLIDLVIAFADEKCAFAVGREFDEATTRNREFRASVDTLRERFADAKGTGSAQPDAALQALLKRCFAAFHDSIFGYFTMFAGRFPTSRSATPWVEAAASFVVDLKKFSREPSVQRS